MVDNPYESPQAPLTRTQPRGEGGDFTIGESLEQAWAGTWETVGAWLPAAIIGFIVTFIAAITIIGYFVVVPVMAWGFAVLLLNVIDRKASIGDVFSGFNNYGTALGRMLLLILVFIGIAIGCNLLAYAGMALDSPGLTIVGQLVGTIANLVITIRLYFAVFMIVDQDMPTMEAISTSWNITAGKGLKVFLMVLLSIPILLAGVLALVVGVIPASMIAYGMFASAYRQMYPAS